MPITRSGPAPAEPATALPEGHARAYRAAIRAALRDGTLTQREELHLAEVAQELRIGARDALALRIEVERELAQA